MKLKSLLFILLALLVATPQSFAAVVVQEDGAQEGIVEKLNFTTGVDVSVSGNTATILNDGSQALTAGSTFEGIAQQYVAPVSGQYFQLYVYDARFSPASGAPSGSVKMIRNAAAANDCGHLEGGTTFNVCVSDGTNWVDLS